MVTRDKPHLERAVDETRRNLEQSLRVYGANVPVHPEQAEGLAEAIEAFVTALVMAEKG